MPLTRAKLVNALKSAAYIFVLNLFAGLLPHGGNVDATGLIDHMIQASYAAILQFGVITGLSSQLNGAAETVKKKSFKGEES